MHVEAVAAVAAVDLVGQAELLRLRAQAPFVGGGRASLIPYFAAIRGTTGSEAPAVGSSSNERWITST
ncbi:hypothetical protein [Tsukamurella sp. PLM1]|uniref:hypothetical protein n=1 Tax=Tsukamurella sp. PLM1 TaxID=2929795 RepID=UPI0035302A07